MTLDERSSDCAKTDVTITDHPFTNSDSEYSQIKKLLLEVENHPEVDNCWEPNRMDYWRYNYHAEKEREFFQTNVHFWKTDGEKVVALFISEYGRNDFYIVVHPRHWEIFPAVLNWGIKNWGEGKEKISTEVYSYGKRKIDFLTAAGFYEDGHTENVRTYDLADYDFSYELIAGFKLMSFAEYGNYESRVELVRNAFGNPKYTEARYRSLQGSPNYRPELDLVIVNTQDEAVAYCIGWVEENNPKAGNIEPMGTHSDYRQHGFGKALAKETFKRQAALGVETAWIVSFAEPNISNYLYESLKPASVKRSYRYSRQL